MTGKAISRTWRAFVLADAALYALMVGEIYQASPKSAVDDSGG